MSNRAKQIRRMSYRVYITTGLLLITLYQIYKIWSLEKYIDSVRKANDSRYYSLDTKQRIGNICTANFNLSKMAKHKPHALSDRQFNLIHGKWIDEQI